jgi:DNA polymerase I-like protein with 3'-5' exonuclease and polymerase domains
MRAPEVVTVDFETEPIGKRPAYPPPPVGVAVKEHGKKPFYMAWGHPSGNNCSKEDARRALLKIWKDPRAKLFHNEKFDVDVGEVHMGLPRLPWGSYHDTMFLSFLDDPDRPNVKLKDVGEEVLGKAPKERDALRDWVLASVPGATRKSWGAHICKSPAHLVGRYAGQGDAETTARLFAKLYPRIAVRGMSSAYDRERRVMPGLLDSERRGMRVDVRLMERDAPFYEALLERADELLRKALKCPGLDLDKDDQLADALDKAGMVETWTLTPGGKRSTNKKALLGGLSDKKVLALLFYRNALATSVRTFMRPWLATARSGEGGRIYTQWNQVRQADGGDPFGARTGRLSSSPNFQNIPIYTRSILILPKLIESGYMRLLVDRAMLARFPWAAGMSFEIEMPDKSKRVVGHACPLPMMKAYVLPEKGHVLVERDYSQQEFRILAHFEDGALLAAYEQNPRMDVHDAARDLIHDILGVMLDRRPVKDVGFSLIYGMGLAELARKTEVDLEQAKSFKGAYLKAMPGLRDLIQGLKQRAAEKQPIVTWGGRQYFCEKPRVVKGRLRTFEYKLINRLVQGSAADCTKEGTARYDELGEEGRRGGLFMMTVHDSTVSSVPKECWKEADGALRGAMESVEFDVPMLTDGKVGAKNLGNLAKIKDAA